MCGIAGIIHLDGSPVAPWVMSAMGDVLRHRGPDDVGQFFDTGVALHHQRLSIIDLASGHQPMTAGGATIVFNGEIYNYLELRDELRRAGTEFSTSSDTEVILHMYARYGPACVEHLNGMFAFLIYDPARRIVMAARDRLGIKPLYYRSDDRRILFGSEIKALLQHPDVRAEAELDAVQEYFTFQHVMADRTLFRGIRKVEPGCVALIDLTAGTMRISRYWEPTFAVDNDHTEQYFVRELQRLLDDSVRLEMRSDVPVGSYLSGGMDSSAVTMLASRRAAGPLSTFTGAFHEGPEFDETAYARDVAEACGAASYVLYPTEDQFVDLLPKLVYQMDEPVAGPGLFPQYLVAKLAAEHVKVVLGGQGGDEVFGGYVRYLVAYLEQALKGAIMETNEEQEHIVSLRSIVPNLPALRQYMPMVQQFWRQDVFEPMDRRYFRLVDRSAGALSLLTPEFREIYSPEDMFCRFQRVFNHPDTRSYFNKMTHYDLVTGLPALLHVEDRMSMAVSLESRVPLLDHRIVDLVARVPPGIKFRGGALKPLLRRAVGRLLPRSVMNRTDKMGFPVPLHLWARGNARDFMRDILLSPTCRNRGLFDLDEVAKLMEYEKAFSRRLWGLLNLELWFRTFIDR